MIAMHTSQDKFVRRDAFPCVAHALRIYKGGRRLIHRANQPGFGKVCLPLAGGLAWVGQQPFDLAGLADFGVEVQRTLLPDQVDFAENAWCHGRRWHGALPRAHAVHPCQGHIHVGRLHRASTLAVPIFIEAPQPQ